MAGALTAEVMARLQSSSSKGLLGDSRRCPNCGAEYLEVISDQYVEDFESLWSDEYVCTVVEAEGSDTEMYWYIHGQPEHVRT